MNTSMSGNAEMNSSATAAIGVEGPPLIAMVPAGS
jgi:hypothetical protein